MERPQKTASAPTSLVMDPALAVCLRAGDRGLGLAMSRSPAVITLPPVDKTSLASYIWLGCDLLHTVGARGGLQRYQLTVIGSGAVHTAKSAHCRSSSLKVTSTYRSQFSIFTIRKAQSRDFSRSTRVSKERLKSATMQRCRRLCKLKTSPPCTCRPRLSYSFTI